MALLAPVAAVAASPSLLFSRGQALARYASALLAAGRPEQALEWARRAVQSAAEDVRGRVLAVRVLAEVLAATGGYAEAVGLADEAVRMAYATEQASERRGAEALRSALAGTDDVTVSISEFAADRDRI
jgi:tetratricopeptide (TPR) repeat protein